MAKVKRKIPLIDSEGGIGIEDFEDEDLYVSTLTPEGYEYDAKPLVDDTKVWTSRQEAKKAFQEQGFSLGAINEDYKISGKLKIHANIGAERFFSPVDISKEPIRQKIIVMKRLKAPEYYRRKVEKSREYANGLHITLNYLELIFLVTILVAS